MVRITLILSSVMLLLVVTEDASCIDANDCLQTGRSYLFDGTVSGLRLAYNEFDDCLNDANCPDCSTDRELRFLHAFTRIIMWATKDDGAPVDSAAEFAREFGVELFGDYFEELQLKFPDYPASQYGSYDMPEDTPDVNELRDYVNNSLIPDIVDFVGNAAIPEIESVIAELDLITESPSDRFRIFFHPHETGLQSDLEVDYAEVLILKSLLTIIKSQLEAKIAYDIFTDPNGRLVEKFYAGTLSINTDLLEPYPDLLKVLPTPGHPNDGKAILAQAKHDLIDGIDYYRAGVNYMLSEEDAQEDDLIYVDIADYNAKDRTEDILMLIRDSLTDDTAITHPLYTTKMYDVLDANSTDRGELALTFDALGRFYEGTFTFEIQEALFSTWDIQEFIINESSFIAEMKLENGWGGGLLVGVVSSSYHTIVNATFGYWGSYNGEVDGLSANVVDAWSEDAQIDLNPVFGSSARYPDPVNPRDLLPEFDSWNGPQPGTMGHGLSDDATLAGIFPEATQYYWQMLFNLQPGGLFYLQEVYPWQKTFVDAYTAYVGVWLEDQLIFEDPSGDTRNGSNVVDNVDIKKLYMGYDYDGIYGTIVLHDYNSAGDGGATHSVYLSYSHDDTDSLYSILMEISSQGSSIWGAIYYMTDAYGYQSWQWYDSFEARYGINGIDFYAPWPSIPDYLPGRFIALKTSGHDYMWAEHDGETNKTNLKMGEVGRISGVVTCEPTSYQGQPIFIRACTDANDLENTLVASTTIEQPGPYTLEGIGMGWSGIVQVSMPCYDFDTQGIDVREVEVTTSVFVGEPETNGVDFVLPSCTMPCRFATEVNVGVPYDGVIADIDQDEVWHYFVPDTNAVLSVSLTGEVSAAIAVYDDCYGSKLVSDNYGELEFNAIGGETYYVKIEPLNTGNYTLTVSYHAPFIQNDLCEDAIDALIDVNYAGSTTGAFGEYETSCGYGDKHDVWYRFAPSQDALYLLEVQSSFWASLAVFDGCGGDELLCTYSWTSPLTTYLNASAGAEYYIRIAGQCGETGPYAFRISQYGPPLQNDLCGDALELIEGVPYAGSTLGAVHDDVWFTFTPVTNGIFDVNVAGFSAELTILDRCDGNEVPSGHAQHVYFNGKAGDTYLIGVKPAWQDGDKDFTVVVTYAGQPLPNDHLEDAIMIEPNVPYTRSTYLATNDGKSTCGSSDDHDVWYSFMPESSGIYQVRLENTDFSAGVSVFEESRPLWLDQLSEVLCHGPYDSRPAYFYARVGNTYYIRIAGYWRSTGNYTVVVDEVSTKLFVGDLNSDGIVDWWDLERFASRWLLDCPQSYWCEGADLNDDEFVNFEDYVFLANEWLKAWR